MKLIARLGAPIVCKTTDASNPFPPTLSTTRLARITVVGFIRSMKMTRSRAALALTVRIMRSVPDPALRQDAPAVGVDALEGVDGGVQVPAGEDDAVAGHDHRSGLGADALFLTAQPGDDVIGQIGAVRRRVGDDR